MKKISTLLFVLTLPLHILAQRYTGYGRGMDWGGSSWNRGMDLFFPILILIIAILGGAFVLVDKIKSYLCPYKKGYIPFRRFKNKFWGLNNFTLVDVVCNETGEHWQLCMFTSFWDHKTYVAFSPYLGECSLKEIIANEKDFFIQVYGKSKSYFVCTIESDKYREENLDTWPYFREEYELEQLLISLNTNGHIDYYTIIDIKDL